VGEVLLIWLCCGAPSLISHLAWHSYNPSLSPGLRRWNRIDHRRGHFHIAQKLPCCRRSDGIINIKLVNCNRVSYILPPHQCTVWQECEDSCLCLHHTFPFFFLKWCLCLKIR
jgi:hypothetical protein